MYKEIVQYKILNVKCVLWQLWYRKSFEDFNSLTAAEYMEFI